MNRRSVLRQVAAVGSISLAGCASNGLPPTENDGGSPTSNPTSTPQVELDRENFDVTNIDSTGEPVAEISFKPEQNHIKFTGTIEGRNGCKTAEREALNYDRESGEVHLYVQTKDRPGTGDQACTQALVYIDYEAVAVFTNGLPTQAAVSHNGHKIVNEIHSSEDSR